MRKALTIFVIFISFYLVAHFWLRWRNESQTNQGRVARLVACDPNEVKNIRLVQVFEQKEQELLFTRVDAPVAGIPPDLRASQAEWRYENPLQGEADASVFSRIAASVCELYNPPDATEPFAIPTTPERRALRVEFTVAGANHQLEFGSVDKSRRNSVRYTGTGPEKVVLIPLKLLQLASLPPEQYRNLKVLRMDSDNIQRASVRSQEKELFALEREGAGWKVSAGGKELGAGSEEAQKYINRLSTLRALEVENSKNAVDNCQKSLDGLQVDLTGVREHKETVFFRFGKKRKITACSSARGAVFSLHQDLLKYLDPPAKKLVARGR